MDKISFSNEYPKKFPISKTFATVRQMRQNGKSLLYAAERLDFVTQKVSHCVCDKDATECDK